MRKKSNPMAIVAVIAGVGAGVALGFVVRGLIPESAASWRGLAFWGVLAGCGAVGAFIGGKIRNKRR